MKKTLIALSVACAGALAFADNAQWKSPWIKGIDATATTLDELKSKAVGGTWTIGADAATYASGALEIDSDEEIKFTVLAASNATAKTAQKISIKGVFTPCAASDLAKGSAMTAAQLGFAVVTGESSASYYVWSGKASTSENATAIDDWDSIGTCASTGEATELTITLSYWGGTTVKAAFEIKNKDVAVTLTTSEVTLSGTAAQLALQNLKVGEIACTGSGTLTALDGQAGVAVATVGETPYATVDEAIAAAKENGGTVEVVVAPSGDVNKGEVTVDTTKECVVAKEGTITVQTKTSILEAITFNDVALKANVSALRTFLSENCSSVYTGADSTTAKLQDALSKTPEDAANKLALWQDYALGIKPSTKLEMGYTTDSATDGVTVKLATTVTPSGDYKITYKCVQVDGNAADVVSSDASAIKLPLTTGRYKVNVVFSAPDAAQN